MVETVKTSISMQRTLFNQAEILAQNLNISQSQLFEIAIENYIRNDKNQRLLNEINQPDSNEQSKASSQDATTAAQIGEGQLIINQGDIYWLNPENPNVSESSIPHPYVVIQDNIFNHSRIHTVVACALTSNIKRANLIGNVLLEVGEANLPKHSVVEVSKISTLDKTELSKYIGSLSERRINQIMSGIGFLQSSFFSP
jgi:mRNA interferase MazF